MDVGKLDTGLAGHLKEKGIKNVIAFGLATDFCVFFTATDAADLGFNCWVVPELCRGIDTNFNLEKFKERGVKQVTIADAKAVILGMERER